MIYIAAAFLLLLLIVLALWLTVRFDDYLWEDEDDNG